MRSVLSFAIHALALLALFAAGRALSSPLGANGRIEPRTILVGSQGHMLPAATMAGSNERFDHAIAVGDLLLTQRDSGFGLRVVTLSPGLELDGVTTTDTASDSMAPDRLMSMLEPLAVGSVVIAAVRGAVRPHDLDTEKLDAFPRAIGADFSPFRASVASWAIISYKLKSGWKTIAEAYSEERAVHLAFTLSPDPSVYDQFQSEVYFVESEGPEELDLVRAFYAASTQTDDVALNPKTRAGGVRVPSVTMRPTVRRPSRIRWKDVGFGPGAIFQASISRAPSAHAEPTEARFSVLLDGVELGSLELATLSNAEWLFFRVELGPDRRTGAALELKTETAESASGPTYYWGRPKLSWGTAE